MPSYFRVVMGRQKTSVPLHLMELMARIFGDAAPLDLTIGSERDTANAINVMGGHHISCTASNIVIDSKHKVVSTPAYMVAGSIGEAADGIEKLVKAVLDLVKQ